jgi:hypothetical protein
MRVIVLSDFGGSEIEFERNMAINGGASNQYQAIPPGNLNYVKNCTLVPKLSGGEHLQDRAPCPNETTATTRLLGRGGHDSSSLPCNVTVWDEICPPTPANPRVCNTCCGAHKNQLLQMNCDGPTRNWNYSWYDHCAGLPPPPWHPPPPPPSPSPTMPIQYSDVQILLPEGTPLEASTVCGRPIAAWQAEGYLKTVVVRTAPPAAKDIVDMARAILLEDQEEKQEGPGWRSRVRVE